MNENIGLMGLPMKIAFWKHFPILDQDAELLASAILDFDSLYDLDIIKITPAGSWLAVCYGVEDFWENDFLGRRTITKRIISDEDDWLKIGDINEKPCLIDDYLKTACILKKQTNKPIFITIFCPISQAIQMAGIEKLKEHMGIAPHKVAKALEIITKNTILLLNRFAEAGISGNFFVTQGMQPDFLSYSEYSTWGKPYDTACLKVSSALFDHTIFHIHGDNIYFNLDQSINAVSLHFEFNAAHSAIYRTTVNNLLPGISENQLKHIDSFYEAENLLREIEESTGKKLTTLTSSCVLPLDFPDKSIIFWKTFMRENQLKMHE